jgi:hypothetical protein
MNALTYLGVSGLLLTAGAASALRSVRRRRDEQIARKRSRDWYTADHTQTVRDFAPEPISLVEYRQRFESAPRRERAAA